MNLESTVDLILGLLRRTHLTTPTDLPGVVADQAAAIGARDVGMYLIDYEQAALMPVPTGPEDCREPLSVVGTVAGRAYSSTIILRAPAEPPGHQRLWVPLLDGTERIGVLGMTFVEPIPDGLDAICERYAHLVAMLVATKGAYSDFFEVIRRRRPMTIASELAQAVAPPRVFATDGLMVAGMLEPAYDNGGDALDYALNEGRLHLAVFDAMGHGLAAAGVAAFAVSAYRYSRRVGRDLLETYEAMDHAVGQQFPDDRFVTAVIAELHLDTGWLRWVSAGHPPPLLIRGGRHARTLDSLPATPLGVELGDGSPEVSEESLEPGDQLLLYTDGLTEARDAGGTLFEIEGLSEFMTREAAAGHTAPETLRRLRQAVLGSNRAQLRDDATALLVEWRRGSEQKLLDRTVE